MAKYDVWIIPDERLVLVTDLPGVPVGASEYKDFDEWFEATDYAEQKAMDLGFQIEYEIHTISD